MQVPNHQLSSIIIQEEVHLLNCLQTTLSSLSLRRSFSTLRSTRVELPLQLHKINLFRQHLRRNTVFNSQTRSPQSWLQASRWTSQHFLCLLLQISRKYLLTYSMLIKEGMMRSKYSHQASNSTHMDILIYMELKKPSQALISLLPRLIKQPRSKVWAQVWTFPHHRDLWQEGHSPRILEGI